MDEIKTILGIMLLSVAITAPIVYFWDKSDKEETERIKHLTHEQYCSEAYYGWHDQRCIGFFAPNRVQTQP